MVNMIQFGWFLGYLLNMLGCSYHLLLAVHSWKVFIVATMGYCIWAVLTITKRPPFFRLVLTSYYIIPLYDLSVYVKSKNRRVERGEKKERKQEKWRNTLLFSGIQRGKMRGVDYLFLQLFTVICGDANELISYPFKLIHMFIIGMDNFD